jgi:hypothetical protein
MYRAAGRNLRRANSGHIRARAREARREDLPANNKRAVRGQALIVASANTRVTAGVQDGGAHETLNTTGQQVGNAETGRTYKLRVLAALARSVETSEVGLLVTVRLRMPLEPYKVQKYAEDLPSTPRRAAWQYRKTQDPRTRHRQRYHKDRGRCRPGQGRHRPRTCSTSRR